VSAGLIYLLAGGRSSLLRGDPVLVEALGAAGRPHPCLAYVGAASGDNRAFFALICAHLKRCGAGRITLAPLAGRKVDLDRARHIIDSADIVFVSGGDVAEGMEVLEARGMCGFLHDLHACGKPFLGLSAGSIMLGTRWVRWEDPDDDTTASIFPCVGLAQVACDTHGEDDGWEEVRALLRLSPEGAIAYGIPAGGGLRIHPDGRAESVAEPAVRFARRDGAVWRESDLAAT
jgi:cyanophycinase-like exopeptidase